MFGNEGNPFDALGNSGIGSSSGDLMDKYKNESSSTSSYGGSTLFSGGENKQKSVFDTISSTGQSGSPFDALSMNKESEGSIMVQKGTFLQEGNIAHDLNVRGQRYGQMSVTDKMRGIQANRLNIDSDSVALEESYADKSLDKRTMNGLYNTTISDIYGDRAKFEAYHGLITDGMIEEREHTQIDSDADIETKEDRDSTLMGGYKVKEVEQMLGFDQGEPNSEQKEIFGQKEIILGIGSNQHEESVERLGDKYKKEDKEDLKEKENVNIRALFTNENKQSIYMEEEEEEEEEEKKKISESKGSQGIYGKEKEEEEDELKKLKIERLIAGGQGVYGNIEIEEKENDLIVKIKEIIEKMSSDKIAEIIQRYDLKPEKDHKDKLKLKIAREILQERSLKEI